MSEAVDAGESDEGDLWTEYREILEDWEHGENPTLRALARATRDLYEG